MEKANIVSVTFRNGRDHDGNPILETLERLEVLDYDGVLLSLLWRLPDYSPGDGEEFVKLTLNVETSEFLKNQFRWQNPLKG